MTYCLNGCGTRIAAWKYLSDDDETKLRQIVPELSEHPEWFFYMGTESITILFLPILPLETAIYADVSKGFDDRYIPVYYPCGKGKVCWSYIKRCWQFYVIPTIIAIILILKLTGHF